MMAFDVLTEIGDDALMALFANGDGEAASILAARHTPRVLALAWRLLSDRAEAEDVAQDVGIAGRRRQPQLFRGQGAAEQILQMQLAATDRFGRQFGVQRSLMVS